MNDKTWIGAGIAALVVPAACFFYFMNSETVRPMSATSAVASKLTPTLASKVAVLLAGKKSTVPDMGPIPKLTDAQRHVTPRLIENFAQSVMLDGNSAVAGGNHKEAWAKLLPAAEALVEHSDADCEQRNWLVRFVACGQLALADSPDYYGSANSLADMPRDQQEAQTGLPSH